MTQVKDPLGTFYCFTLPKSIIKRTVTEKKRVKKEA
jgi:F420-non-reducing hydrogenase small subunit